MLSVTAVRSADAQANRPLRVQWLAPSGCADAGEVEALIRARLPNIDPAMSVDVRARVTRHSARAYRVQISLGGALAGERELEAESCTAAAEATALLVALAIDPAQARSGLQTANPSSTEASKPSAEPTTAPTADTEPTADANRESQDDVTPTADTEAERDVPEAEAEAGTPDAASDVNDPVALSLQLGAGIPIDWGTTPGVTTGAMIVAGLSIERVLLMLSGTWLMSRETSIAPGATLSAGWMSAAFDGCYLMGASTAWGPCLGVDVGQLASRTTGLLDAVHANEMALFASGSVIARVRLTNVFYAALWLGMRTSVWYPRLVVAGLGEAFQPTAIGLRAAFALTVVLG